MKVCIKYIFFYFVLAGGIATLYADNLNQDFVVAGVIVDGNKRIDTAAIRIQLKAGEGRISRVAVGEDIKTLYKTGFFDQVSANIVTKDGKNFLQYSLVEKPTVRKVFIQGNDEIGEGELTELLAPDTQRFLDKGKIQALIRRAVTFYQGRGFYDVEFDYSVVPIGDNQVDLTFVVKEGKKYKIRKVEFRGLQAVDVDDLSAVIETKRYKWWNSWLLGTGRLNKDMLENDRGLVRQYLLDQGYVDGNVSEATIKKVEDGLQVSFDIEEGQRYSYGEINASGDLFEGDVTKTLEGVKTKSGEFFSASVLRDDAFRVSDKFTDVGYAFANVVPDTSVDRREHKVNVNFTVTQGKLITVNRIGIRGNAKTYDNVIRRDVKIDEREIYSSKKIRRSEQLLRRLGIFEEVNISSEPTDKEDEVDLTVNVREGSTGTFSAGAGYSTADGVLFNTRLSENNIFGTGRRASISFDIGSERDNIILAFEDRRINDSHVAGGVDLLRAEREFSDFDRKLEGGGVTLGYPLEEVFGEWAEDIAASLKYEYLDIEISDVDEESSAQLVIDSEGTSTASGFIPKLVRNTIDNPLNPSKGSRQELSVEVTGLGGSEEYYLIEASQTWYKPLFDTSFGSFIFSWRADVGYGETFDDEDFPLFRRFFPGGINSVRGYKNRTLGPKDEDGNEYGGSKQLINNLEVIFPLINSAGLRGVVFYDIGEAFDDDVSIEFSELREAYGFGIRWTSPLGPIRVEFGFPVDREEGEDSMVTLFSFGAPL